MSEDIIARLTQNAEDFCNCPLCIRTINTMHDAAKEIERLRTAINSLLVNIDDAHDNVGKYGLCITCDVADGSWPCVHRIVLDELKQALHAK